MSRPVSEKSVEQYFVQQATVNKCLTYKWSSPSNRGVPDRLLIMPFCSTIFVELKTKGGKLSVLQIHTLDKLAAAGQTCYVIWNREQVDDLFAGRLVAWKVDDND